MTTTLYIIGAGPGDPDLISVKGMRLLQRADVVLYDALVSPELLAAARPRCRMIYVGKRKGHKEFPQEEINALLVFYAQRFNCVVRLKGGDPYVFGRGHEELEFASRHGVKVEVIPGISSALAAPSVAGIPLTKRGVNESFWVITGTLSSGEISGDIQLAAQSSATVIVLMGLNQLQKIASIFLQMRSAMEPVAVIEKATLPGQRVITGTAATIFNLAKQNEINTPAIIVIGKVVNERHVMNSLKEVAMVPQTQSKKLDENLI